MNRWTVLALGLLCISLALVILGALRAIREDRAEVLERFAQERVEQVDLAARLIDDDLAHVGDDIRVAGRLAQRATSPEIMQREISALLDVVESYQMIRVYDGEGAQQFSAGSAPPSVNASAVERVIDDAVKTVLQARPPGMYVSRPVEGAESRRVFAAILPAIDDRPMVVVAVLVDTAPLLDKLRLVAADQRSHLLVIGPYGNPTTVSDARLQNLVEGLDGKGQAFPKYTSLLEAMRRGERGVVQIDRGEAERLGLGALDVFAAYASTPTKRAGSWSICSLRNGERLETHDRTIVRRFGVATSLLVMLIIAFGAYVTFASRRAITDRERLKHLAQAQLLASQLIRAEKLATVGVLAAGIAHEIGTPLAIVRGRAEYAVGKLASDHALSKGMRVIVEQIDLISRTIRQLLDFSRVQPPATPQLVHVADVANTVAELLRFEAERRKVTISLDLPDDLSPVAANSDQLQQTLVNLVMNACHACKPGGHVTISARANSPSGQESVRIDVTDDGQGVPAEHRAQVFDPFFTTKKRGQGTGLGLTIAAQIVRNHGGQIELESEPGKGSRVTLVWPSASARISRPSTVPS